MPDKHGWNRGIRVTEDLYEIGEDGLPRRLTASERHSRQDGQSVSSEPVRKRKGAVRKTRNPESRQPKGTTLVSQVDHQGTKIKITEIQLPGGASVSLTNPQEIVYLSTMAKRYQDDYGFVKPNDLARLSQLLMLELQAFRMMQRMTGTVPDFDEQGKATGKFVAVSDEEVSSIIERLPKVQDEIRKLERALKIDKTAREGDGSHDVSNYFETLKKAALDYGVHLSERYAAYDNFVNELRWKVRVLRNADEEDRRYHNISEKTIVDYVDNEISVLEDLDVKFAKDKQALWVGKL